MSVGKDNGLVQKEIMELSCLVQVTGQDPKLVKAKSSPFYKVHERVAKYWDECMQLIIHREGMGNMQMWRL